MTPDRRHPSPTDQDRPDAIRYNAPVLVMRTGEVLLPPSPTYPAGLRVALPVVLEVDARPVALGSVDVGDPSP